jgi:ABC transporter
LRYGDFVPPNPLAWGLPNFAAVIWQSCFAITITRLVTLELADRRRADNEPILSAIIEAHDLVKRFDGFTAVDHLSFAVPEGVIFGFLGVNGAGKTTTIKMLTTVLMPSEGRLSIAGHDPVKEPLLVRRAFGIVFQDPSLDDELTAGENMELHGRTAFSLSVTCIWVGSMTHERSSNGCGPSRLLWCRRRSPCGNPSIASFSCRACGWRWARRHDRHPPPRGDSRR